MKFIFADNKLLNYHQRLSRLRLFTASFILLLFIPIGFVFYKGLLQINQERLFEFQHEVTKTTELINKRLFKRSAMENAISVGMFDYRQYLYNPESTEVTQQISSLASLKNHQQIKGVVGYFQYGKNGRFNSPIWSPELENNSANVDSEVKKEIHDKLWQLTQRSETLRELISQSQQKFFERFKLVTDVPRFLIFYRIVSFGEETRIQGYVIDTRVYISALIKDMVEMGSYEHPMVITLKSRDDETIQHFRYYRNANGLFTLTKQDSVAVDNHAILVGRHKLNWPYTGYVLEFAIPSLPLPATAAYTLVFMLVLVLAIILACYGFYRLGVKQLKLAEQRLNFVSSVSHELKTPLTSIRMYSEMLKSGMVLSADHQNEYYDFIHSESERLSRLIDNILQLAKLSQPHQLLQPEYVKLSVLIDIIRSKLSSMLEKAHFALNIHTGNLVTEDTHLWVDTDAFSQVVINLADNAIKFFDEKAINDNTRKKIDFDFVIDQRVNNQLMMTVRDYGLGITKTQEGKIFELFYRGGSELTRSTQGTGIGLALVNELMAAQQGDIRVRRVSPGLALDLRFKCNSN